MNLYSKKKQNAKQRGIEFTLTKTQFNELLSRTECYYTGIPIVRREGLEEKYNSLTLDRIDNKRGYTPDNVVTASLMANRFKNIWESPTDPMTIEHAKIIIDKTMTATTGKQRTPRKRSEGIESVVSSYGIVSAAVYKFYSDRHHRRRCNDWRRRLES